MMTTMMPFCTYTICMQVCSKGRLAGGLASVVPEGGGSRRPTDIEPWQACSFVRFVLFLCKTAMYAASAQWTLIQANICSLRGPSVRPLTLRVRSKHSTLRGTNGSDSCAPNKEEVHEGGDSLLL